MLPVNRQVANKCQNPCRRLLNPPRSNLFRHNHFQLITVQTLAVTVGNVLNDVETQLQEKTDGFIAGVHFHLL